MDDFNPYAAPRSELWTPGPGEAAEGVWRDGDLLLMRKTAALPDRCVRCNQPALGRRLKRNLAWHRPALYALLLLNVLIYIIVAVMVRQKANIEVGVCERHLRRRRRAIGSAWIVAVAGIGLLIAGGSQRDADWTIVLSFVLILVGLIIGIVGSQLVTPKKIDLNFVWLKGVHPDYLRGLPDWQNMQVRWSR